MASKQKKSYETASPMPANFSDLRVAAGKVGHSFLRGRLQAYIDAAERLLTSYDGLKTAEDAGAVSGLASSLASYGKCARSLDFTIAVAQSSGHIPVIDKGIAHQTRLSVEKLVAQKTSLQNDGTVEIATPSGILQTSTQSKVGRRIAGIFARLVPPSAQAGAASSGSYLPHEQAQKLETHIEKAQKLRNERKYAESEREFKAALEIDRKNLNAIVQLGLLYMLLQKNEAAISYFEQAMLLQPFDPVIHIHLGNSLINARRVEEGIEKFERSIKLNPNYVEAYAGLGAGYRLAGEDKKAQEILERGLKRFPASGLLYAQMAVQTLEHMDIQQALSYCKKALKAMPNNVQSLHAMGVIMRYTGQHRQAITYMDKALSYSPFEHTILLSKSMALLNMGKFKEGWRLYDEGCIGHEEIRRGSAPISDRPVWRGESDPKLRLVVVHEQGLGDTLQFIRYVALCKGRVGKVMVLTPPPLARLLKECSFIDEVVTTIEPSEYDAQIAMMSLPYLFTGDDEKVQAEIPYLSVPQEARDKWKGRIKDSGKLKIGLVWSGSGRIGTSRAELAAERRNVPLQDLMPVLNVPGTEFYSLQLGEAANQVGALGLKDKIIDITADIKDLADTAAIIEELDLVLTVDTSVAHLAGGMGKPVWLMSRYDCCWRWMGNRSSNPWYPQARIFGQSRPHDWKSVITRVADALQDETKK